MFAEVEKYCRQNELLHMGDKILVACSGGPDSLALVLFFLAVREKWQLEVAVAHFEHGIRGSASVADAEFVRKFCAAKKLKCYLAGEDVPAYAMEHKISVEMAARSLRYDFLQEKAEAMGGALIATAHHADDQAETVLMRILRGTGVSGLAAIRPRAGNIIRPFLCISKAECERICAVNGIEPCYDATNGETVYLRNRLRHNLLPLLKDEYNPAVGSALCQLAELAAADTDFIIQSITDIKNDIADVSKERTEIDRQAFRRLHTAQQRALLRDLVSPYLPGPAKLDFCQIEKIRDFIAEGTTGSALELPFGLLAAIVYDKLVIRRNKAAAVMSAEAADLPVPGRAALRGTGLIVEAELLTKKPDFAGENWAVFDYDKLYPPLLVRRRRNGDRIKLKAGTKKVKDLLIDLKIPREKREKLVLVTDCENVLWLGGIKRAAIAAVDENTERFLLLRLIPDTEKGAETL